MSELSSPSTTPIGVRPQVDPFQEPSTPGHFAAIPIGVAALFIATKVEDEYREMDHVVIAALKPVHKSVRKTEMSRVRQMILDYETTILMTLGKF